MRQITREIYNKMLQNNCNKSKHRFRTNDFGITWCTICGLLSNKPADKASNEDLILIKNV